MGVIAMIHEAKTEYCVVVEYPDGYKFCKAKFMDEEDARNYKRSRKKKDYVVYRLYERKVVGGEVVWEEM
jgi:hypothetical protein